jgi:hypothetical protein
MFRLFALLALAFSATASKSECPADALVQLPKIYPQNNCVSFTVGQGTGCAWMCTYCAGALGTNNYYFTDGVCTYQTGGCVGNPQAGVTYTCCAA